MNITREQQKKISGAMTDVVVGIEGLSCMLQNHKQAIINFMDKLDNGQVKNYAILEQHLLLIESSEEDFINAYKTFLFSDIEIPDDL